MAEEMKRRVFIGVNGKRIGVDLSSVTNIEEMGDDEVHLWLGSEQLRVIAPFDDVLEAWQDLG